MKMASRHLKRPRATQVAEMQIFVILREETITLEVKSSDSIAAVRSKILAEAGFPSRNMKKLGADFFPLHPREFTGSLKSKRESLPESKSSDPRFCYFVLGDPLYGRGIEHLAPAAAAGVHKFVVSEGTKLCERCGCGPANSADFVPACPAAAPLTEQDVLAHNLEAYRLLKEIQDREDSGTLAEYDIQKGSTLQHTNTAGHDYLRDDSLRRRATLADAAGVVDAVDVLHVTSSEKTGAATALEVHPPLLGESSRVALIAQADEAFHKGDGGRDTKASLSMAELRTLVGADVTSQLISVFCGRVDRVIVRRVEAQGVPRDESKAQGRRSKADIINFHLDHSERTMQVPLNSPDDYDGGEVVFATRSDGFVSFPRTPGSATVHTNKIVHGVTELRAGVRYSLFFLQQSLVSVGA